MFAGLFTSIIEKNEDREEKDSSNTKKDDNSKSNNLIEDIKFVAKLLTSLNKTFDIACFFQFLNTLNDILVSNNLEIINYENEILEMFSFIVNLSVDKITVTYKQIILQNISNISNLLKPTFTNNVNNKQADSFNYLLPKSTHTEVKDDKTIINHNYMVQHNNIIMVNNTQIPNNNITENKSNKNYSFLGKKKKKENIPAKTIKKDGFDNYYDDSSSEKEDPKYNPVKNTKKQPQSFKKEVNLEAKYEQKVISDLYKNSKSANFFIFEDKYKSLIEKVNNPKRKGKSESMNNKQELYAYLEKTKIFKVELNQFMTSLYNEELEKVLNNNKKHQFMKEHFPSMYEDENFYKYIYLVNKGRNCMETLICEVPAETENTQINKIEQKEKSILSQNKIIWKPCNEKISENQIEDLLFKVEMKFPMEEFKWTQEVVLELLMKQDYNIQQLLVILDELNFKQVIEDKVGKSTDEIPLDDNTRKQSLRKTSQRQMIGYSFK